MSLKLILLILSLSFGCGLLKAQNSEYGVILDTNYMMIGDQQNLTFQVKSDLPLKVIFPLLKDTVTRGVEIISGPVRDSLKGTDGKWLFKESYVITAFDSGVYVIPTMPIQIEGKEYNNILRTEQVAFVVNTFQVDAQKDNYDIVMPYATPWTFAEILPYLLWTLLGLLVIGVSWWLFVRFRKNKPLFVSKKEEIPPYVKAIKSLDEIKADKLWQAGKEKEYYTRLTDTLRQYLDDEFQIPAMEQTSVETLRSMANCPEIESRDKDRVSDMLTTADFVKFAKFTPLQDESARYLDTAYDFVNNTHQRLQQEMAEKQKEEETRRKEEEKTPEKPEDVKTGNPDR